jgi:hypothetical protein
MLRNRMLGGVSPLAFFAADGALIGPECHRLSSAATVP